MGGGKLGALRPAACPSRQAGTGWTKPAGCVGLHALRRRPADPRPPRTASLGQGLALSGGKAGLGTGTGWNGSGAAAGMTCGGPTWPRLPPQTVQANCVRDRTGKDPTVSMTTALKRATAP